MLSSGGKLCAWVRTNLCVMCKLPMQLYSQKYQSPWRKCHFYFTGSFYTCKNFFNRRTLEHAIYIHHLHCSVRFIICDTALHFAAIIRYVLPSNWVKNIHIETGIALQSWNIHRNIMDKSSSIEFGLPRSNYIKCIQPFKHVLLMNFKYHEKFDILKDCLQN